MNEGVTSSLIGVDGLKFEDINQCQTETNDDKSSDKNSENELEEEWYSQLNSVQIDTLSLQRKFSSELKTEKSCSNLTSSPPTTPSKTRRLLRRQAKPTVVAPKNKIEKQVVDFKSQLLTIEALINANEPKPEKYYPNREEIKSKIKSQQKKVRSSNDHMDPVEIRSKPLRSPRKSLAPPPPPQQQQLQTDLIAPKIVVTKQSDYSPSSSSSPFTVRRPSSFGIQWKKVQNSKSVKFLTDSSPIRKNFRGFRKAFKSSEDSASTNNDNSENHRLSDALVTFSMEEEVEEEEEDFMGRKILKNLHLDNSKINREYLSELVDILAKQIDSDVSSESSESDDEEEVISEMALREIATFEKLIEDYKQEIS